MQVHVHNVKYCELLNFVSYQFSWFLWRIQTMKSSTHAWNSNFLNALWRKILWLNVEHHDCVIQVQSMKTCTTKIQRHPQKEKLDTKPMEILTCFYNLTMEEHNFTYCSFIQSGEKHTAFLINWWEVFFQISILQFMRIVLLAGQNLFSLQSRTKP